MERRHWLVSDALCKLIVLHIDYQIQISPQKLVLLQFIIKGWSRGLDTCALTSAHLCAALFAN